MLFAFCLVAPVAVGVLIAFAMRVDPKTGHLR